ncbi:MAG: GGDEF domain-containing protein [Gammaproteobacteria bacterium]|jgi:diguanylate cyclase (GGDEF)-like protein|nr:GGDEF domain-containing protein [Gammaproteobacteria bacterium]
MDRAQQAWKLIQSKNNEALQQQSFSLGQVLQTTLDVYTLIKNFHQELQKFIPNHSFHYHNIQTQHGLDINQPAEFQANYQLMLEGISLGDIYITRSTAFTQLEITSFENALQNLLYPLRNAIFYHEAVSNSFTCPLTKIGNRRAYDKFIEREIEFAKRHKTEFALVVIDVDHFKAINDKYGHSAGDHILNMLAKIMTQLNRTTDPLFRYGGEEFVLILNHTHLAGAIFVAERLREQIQHAEFIFHDVKIPITISLGITNFQINDNAERMFARADKALYSAKKLGRNQVVVSGNESTKF